MCGICGIVRLDNNLPDEKAVRRMMAVQKHRGPNDEGFFLHNNIGLGFVRLSILDLTSQGHQPMTDEWENYTLVFNGEIYNYIELRQELIGKGYSFKSNSDTEVLLKMYIHYGSACLDKLNGMFAFVIYDKKSDTIFGARDRFGVKPFYYFVDHSQFIFASEIPPILQVYNQPNKANENAIFEYLLHNRTDQTENTFFDGVKKLQHGHCFTIVNKRLSIKKWYCLADRVQKTVDFDVDKYKALFTDAVRLRLRSDVPVGVCLSGGLDSSAIVSVISHELGKGDVHTFSAVYQPGSVEDESSFIRLYKDELPNMHFVTPTSEMLLDELSHFVRFHAEPMPSTSPFAQYCVMKAAKDNVTVTLDGQGADEALGGYHYFFGFYFKELLRKWKFGQLLSEITHYRKNHQSYDALKFLLYFLLPSSLKRKVSVKETAYLHPDFVARSRVPTTQTIINDLYGSDDLKGALLNHFEYKLEHLLKWSDRNSMACSIESRTPFLDYRLVEYTLSLSSVGKIHKGETKHILRKAMTGILPEPIRRRHDKIGFETPQDDWFRTSEFKQIVLDVIDSESFKNRGLIDVNKAKTLYDKHLRREIHISKDIWKWIHLELWFREFIDKR